MTSEAHGRELGVGDGDAIGILPAVEFRADAQPRPAVGGSDEADDGGEVDERRAAPIHRNVREETVLDFVPLARARRKMTDRDREPGPGGQLLQFPLPEAQPGAVAPAGIRRDEQRRAPGDTRDGPCAATTAGSTGRQTSPCRGRCPHSPSLRCDGGRRRHRESPCRPPGVGITKSWTRTRCGRLAGTPRAPRILEVTDQLFLLRIHRDRGLLRPLGRAHAAGNVAKLRVPVGVLAPFARLDVPLQARMNAKRSTGRGTHRFGGDWTTAKLDVIARYLASYTTALKGKPSTEHPFVKGYIDAFAGTGYRNARRDDRTDDASQALLLPDLAEAEPQALLDGSSRLALKTEPRFDRYIFIERSPERCAQLELLKQEFPDLAGDIQIRRGDANTEIHELCAKDWSSHRAVLFLDPYGMQVDWKTIEAIAGTKAIDLWVLFPLGIGVNRLLTKSGEIPESWRRRLSLLLGTEDWYEEFYRFEMPPRCSAERWNAS